MENSHKNSQKNTIFCNNKFIEKYNCRDNNKRHKLRLTMKKLKITCLIKII